MSESLSTEMEEIIDEAYELFSEFSPPKTYALCTCPCCVDELTIKELKAIPLKELESITIYDYLNAVSDKAEPDNTELPYLLPRILELLANWEEIHHSVECALGKMKNLDPDVLSEKHYDLLIRFAEQYLEDTLQWAEAEQQTINIASLLITLDYGNIDIRSLLANLAKDSRLWSVMSIAELIFGSRENSLLTSAFVDSGKDGDQLNPLINGWIKNSYFELAKNARKAVEDYPINLFRVRAKHQHYHEFMQDEWLLALCDEAMILNTIS